MSLVWFQDARSKQYFSCWRMMASFSQVRIRPSGPVSRDRATYTCPGANARFREIARSLRVSVTPTACRMSLQR